MTPVMIDLEDGRTVPMTPSQELGAAFAHVIATALTWDTKKAAEINNFHDNVTATGQRGYDEANDRIGEALREAGLAWSCQFGEPDSDPEAGPYIATLARQVSPGAANVSAAVLARNLRLVTRVDFALVTDWWIAAGQPIHQAVSEGVWADGPDEIERQQRKLYYTRGKVAGWPLTAVDAPEETSHAGLPVPAPGPEWGAGVAAIVATANGWDDRQMKDVGDRHYAATVGAPGLSGFDVGDRLRVALLEAGVDWENPGYRTVGGTALYPWTVAGQVASAVLARDLGLISDDDFAAVTGPWVAAGMPLPDPHPPGTPGHPTAHAADEDQIEKTPRG